MILEPEGLSEIAVYTVASYIREDFEYEQLLDSIVFSSHHEAVKFIERIAEENYMRYDETYLNNKTVKAYSRCKGIYEYSIRLELKFMYV